MTMEIMRGTILEIDSGNERHSNESSFNIQQFLSNNLKFCSSKYKPGNINSPSNRTSYFNL